MIKKILVALGLSKPAQSAPPPPAPRDPELQRLIDDGIARFKAWQDANVLPAVFLDTAGKAAPTPGGSRVGGPAWLPEGTDWPLDGKGDRLAFLAQLDLGELPDLPDFPTHGVLQFFIGTDDLYGCNFDKPEAGDFKVLWHEDTSVPGAMHDNMVPSGDLHADYSPLDKEVLATGLALTGRTHDHKPGIDSWWVNRDLADLFGKHPVHEFAVADAIYDYADQVREDEPFEAHHMGGHPQFTQSDYREMAGYQDVDRVLLNLWSQSGDEQGRWSILWGDVGQGQFTIRREDLLARRFDKALYQWDCS